jgi:membrane-associated phospholipid phosphatase
MRPLHGFLESMEPFGQPTAILMFAGGLWLCSPRLRSGVPRLLAASLGAGLAADVCKLFLARVRPRSFDWSGGPLATFHEFLPGLGRGSSHQSCPSSHTATALGFGLALSTMFPEGRWLFLTAAALVAAQRVECGAHFLSDTVCGATVGYAMSLLLFRPRLLGSWFDLQEARGWRRAESELAPVVLADSPAADPGTQRQAS